MILNVRFYFFTVGLTATLAADLEGAKGPSFLALPLFFSNVPMDLRTSVDTIFAFLPGE